MHSSTSVLALVFNLLALQRVSAQSSGSLPACGQTCISSAMTDFSDECSSSDASCFCSNSDFGSEVDSCIAQQCTSSADQDATMSYLQSYCGAASSSSSTSPTTVSGGTSVTAVTSDRSAVTIMTQSAPFANGTINSSFTTRSSSNMTSTDSQSSSVTSAANQTVSATRTPTSASTSAPNSGIMTSVNTGMVLSAIVFAGLLNLGL